VAFNARQKMVQQAFLDNEEAVIKRLKTVYNKSLEDITDKAAKLQKEFEELEAIYDNIEDEEEKKVLKSRMRSKVYQKQYQESLKKQVSEIIDKLHDEDFKTVSEYLEKCYDEGFLGTMYDLQGQGIPVCFPLDQESMVRAVQLDSKISKGLYDHLGENYSLLKKRITSEVSRGIASSMTYAQIAQQLAGKMTGIYKNPGGALAYSMRIARTEGHRIQCQATMDACYNAKDRGADVVKQWDATLDARTRNSHAAVDGEVKELEEKFSNGLMFPGDPSGRAEEVIHCRCALLQKARWAVGSGFTKMNNFTKQLETFESPEDYAEFKKAFFSKENKAYMNHVQKMEEKYGTKDFASVLDKMDTREYNRYEKLVAGNPVFNNKALTNPGGSGKIPVKKASTATDFDELDRYFDSTYQIKMDSAVKALDFGAVKQSLEGIDEMLTEFPDVAKTLTLISTDKSGVMACVGNKITFNPDNFTDASNIEDLCRKYDGGWWVKGVSPASIGVHETAHAVEWELIQMNSSYLYDWQRIEAWNKCSEAKILVSQACKNIKKTPFGKGKKNAELIGGISRYAHDSASETMAEAFADVYANGTNAHPLSVEIRRLTGEQIKKYKGVI
jgi:hypothetical protein